VPDASDRLRLTIDLPLSPEAAFDLVIPELLHSLARGGVRLEPGPTGTLREGGAIVGEATSWQPGRRAEWRWRPAPWQPDLETRVELHVTPTTGGSTVVVEHHGWERAVEAADERAGWFAGELVAAFLRATTPSAFGDWLTDRRARRPAGAGSRATYADPLYHYPNFKVILAELALTPGDYLLEVGCGGGALMKEALASGCRAAAIDHSPEMVRLAKDANAAAVAEGRLQVFEADATRLPFDDETFTRAAMTGVLGFLPDPVAAFAEIRRVLQPGGRFVGLGSDPELRGTPAAPEPMASRLRFYESEELEALARAAGFADVRILRRDLEAFAREVGVPEEHLPLFAAGPDGGGRFVVCTR
jgi:SAM-dependent methyltransferase